MKKITIAIDGHSSCGKSTMAKSLARKLGYIYVDTGAIYRTVGLYVARCRGDCANRDDVLPRLPEIQISMEYGEDGLQHMILNGTDVTDRIRTPEMSAMASGVAAQPCVRSFLLDMQRQLAKTHNVIMDGRDIGTVILPDAPVKIFMTASNEARALRRVKELAEKGMPADYETVLADMIARDAQDREREIAPCVPAADAVVLDNSDLDFEQSVDAIISIVETTLRGKGMTL